MWKTTIKGLMAHKLRLALTALAVVLGVGFIAGTFVLTDTMNKTFDGLFSDVTAGVDVFVRRESGFESQLGSSRQPFDESLLLRVRGVEGVDAASGSVSGYAQYIAKDGTAITTGGAPTLGANYYDEPKGSLTIREGREPRADGEVVMDAGTAEKNNFEVGDTVRVLSVNAARDFEITGIAGFGDADNLAGATLAVFSTPTAQELFGKENQLDSIDIAAEDGVTTAQLIDRISDVLPDGMEAVSGESVAEEQAENLKELLGFFNTILLVFAGIAVFVGAFIIFNTFSITVAQRTREFGLLRALGASGRQVTMSVFIEALLVGIFASLIGLAAGVGIAASIKSILSTFGIDIPSSGLVFLPRTVFVTMGVGIVVTLVAAIGPARRAAKISPMAALRESAPTAHSFSRVRTLFGLLVLLVGGTSLAIGLAGDFEDPIRYVGAGAVVIFLGVAILAPLFAGPLARLIGAPVAKLRNLPGKLARQNAARSPRRTAATAAALMIGLALVAFVSILGSSVKASTDKALDDTLKADYTVSNASPTGPPTISPEVANELYDLPEVESVAPIRLGDFKNEDGDRFFLVGTDPDALQAVADVDVVEGDLEALEEGGVFLFDEAAQEQKLGVGDKITLEFPATGKQELEVVGIFSDKALIQSDYLVSIPTFEANYPDRADARLLVKLKPGVIASEAKEALQTVEDRFPNVKVEDQAETKETQASQINQLLGLVTALLGLAILIALLGITNTLALSVFERTRELGLLRAVGMARKQARSMIRWEAVIIAIIGACLGLVIGIFFGWAVVTALESDGITELAIPAGQLLSYVVIAGLAGVLAAIPPARRAARLNVLEAISAE